MQIKGGERRRAGDIFLAAGILLLRQGRCGFSPRRSLHSSKSLENDDVLHAPGGKNHGEEGTSTDLPGARFYSDRKQRGDQSGTEKKASLPISFPRGVTVKLQGELTPLML